MSFLQDYKKLLLSTPKLALTQWFCQNSDYTTFTNHSRDSFICRGSGWLRDSYYLYWVYHGEDVVDCAYCEKCELCYECVDCMRCYGCDFCQDCKDSHNLKLCCDCTGCTDCFGCAGLVRKKNRIFNKQVSKEEFEKFERKVSDENLAKFEEIKKQVPHRDFILKSEDCLGNHIEYSQRCYWCFDMVRSRDCMYCFNAYEMIDCVDSSFNKEELGYERVGGGWNFNCDYGVLLLNCADCKFCFQCQNCKNCFGCDGLHHKQYYILNRPCSGRDEYEVRVAEIWRELKGLESAGSAGLSAGNLMSVFEDEEFEGIEH